MKEQLQRIQRKWEKRTISWYLHQRNASFRT